MLRPKHPSRRHAGCAENRVVKGKREIGYLPLSAEGKRKGLYARIEKPDFERAIGGRATLSDELIEPLLVYGTVASSINIRAMVFAGRAPSIVTRNRIGCAPGAGRAPDAHRAHETETQSSRPSR